METAAGRSATIRCAEYRRYLSSDLDRLAFETASEEAVRTSNAGGLVRRLDWDSAFFGVPSGRIEMLWRDTRAAVREAWDGLVPALLARAAERGLVFLDARVAADEMELVQAFESAGFHLVDAQAVYLRDLRGETCRPPAPVSFDVEAFLREALVDMQWGRLYVEPRVAREQAETFYLRCSLSHLARGALTTAIFEDGAPAGLAIGVVDEEGSRLAQKRLGYLWLFIVAPRHKGRGLGKRLFNQFCAEFASVADFVEIGTQIQNEAANRIYRSAGNLPVAHAFTLHRWA